VQLEDHPARRATRYHWAAGLNPLHWGPALLGWGAAIVSGGMGAVLGYEPGITLAPWLAVGAMAWSGVWLVAMPNTPRFRRAVDAALKARYEHDFDYQYAELIERIDSDLHDKVQSLGRLRDHARTILTDKFGEHDLFAKDNLQKLDTLATSYLQLLVALSEYDQYLSLVDPESIEHELVAAERGAQVDDEVLRQARQRHVDLLKNRLTRYQRAQKRLELIQAQCRNIDTTLKLLIDQAMVAVDPQRVGRDIDQVLTNIRESEILTAELQTYEDLERELDDTRAREVE